MSLIFNNNFMKNENVSWKRKNTQLGENMKEKNKKNNREKKKQMGKSDINCLLVSVIFLFGYSLSQWIHISGR